MKKLPEIETKIEDGLSELFAYIYNLERKVERYFTALKFYADQDNWVPTKSNETNSWSYTTIYSDSARNDDLTGGEKARQALRDSE